MSEFFLRPNTLRSENPQMDVCLNCRRPTCRFGVCDDIRRQPKDYVLKKTYVTQKGIEKQSYVIRVTDKGGVHTSTNLFDAMRRTKAGAEELLMQAKKLLKKNAKLEVVKIDEESKKIFSEQRKTKRTGYVHTDSNGNRLGYK